MLFRATEDEHRDWTAAAERAGMLISEWVREACHRLWLTQSPPTKKIDVKPPVVLE